MLHFPPEFLDAVNAANDIVEVASEYFDLTKMGSIYQAQCIHGDKNTKSLTIYPATNSFYCFGCHAGAKDTTGSSDVIAFVAWVEDLPWQDAVIHLAKRADMPLPVESLSAEDAEKLAMFSDLREQNVTYWEALGKDKEIYDWFLSRGITPEQIDAWRLGVDDGRPVYAIIDEMGRTCGFSRRRRPDSTDGPKYRNSNESIVFKKGTILYGLHNIKRLIRKEGYAVLVEGFNDVIALQQYDVPALGIMGTSLTDAQITLLKKYTDNVILFLDGDDGGYNNAWRLIDKLQRADMMVKVISIDGLDPDDLAHKKQEAVKSFIICEAVLAGQYKINELTARYNASVTVMGKALIKDMMAVLKHIPDKAEQDIYIKQVAITLGIRPVTLWDMIERGENNNEKGNFENHF